MGYCETVDDATCDTPTRMSFKENIIIPSQHLLLCKYCTSFVRRARQKNPWNIYVQIEWEYVRVCVCGRESGSSSNTYYTCPCIHIFTGIKCEWHCITNEVWSMTYNCYGIYIMYYSIFLLLLSSTRSTDDNNKQIYVEFRQIFRWLFARNDAPNRMDFLLFW